jgi:hypothetical protein
MSEELNLKVGDRVRHVDYGDAAAVIVRFSLGWDVIVRWESTGRESSVNVAYLTLIEN